MKERKKQRKKKWKERHTVEEQREKKKANQAICAIKRASELMNLVSCGLRPEENEQFR